MAEVLGRLTSEAGNAALKDRPLIVIRNGDLVVATDYDLTVISKDDEITVMPFTAGG